MIEPDSIPRITGDLSVVYLCGETLTTKGKEFAATGSDVHATWQALGNFYRAPEAATLLTATAPVKAKAARLGSDFVTIGNALMRYVDTARPLQLRLWTLWDAAWTFRDRVAGDDDWRKDPGNLEEHNHLLYEVDQAVAAWEAAERECANTINALFGGTHYVADNLDGHDQDNEYGLTATEFGIQVDTAAGLPWGSTAEEDQPVSQDILNALRNFSAGLLVDGAEGDLKGLLALANPFQWSQFTRSWAGIANLGLLLTPNASALIAVNQHQKLLWIPKGELGADRDNFVKGLTAWDDWRQNPARAAGHVTWNILSIVAGPKGSGTVTKLGKLALDSERTAATFNRATEFARSTAQTVRDAFGTPALEPAYPHDASLLPDTVPGAAPPASHIHESSTPHPPADSPDPHSSGDSPGRHPADPHSGDSTGRHPQHADAPGDGHRPASHDPHDTGRAESGSGDSSPEPLSTPGDDPHEGSEVANSSPGRHPWGDMYQDKSPDPAADALARRLHGQSRVKFRLDPKGREFDAVSDKYIAQSKPADFRLGQSFRNQAKGTFEAARLSGREAYFHFEGPPDPAVISKLREYSERYGVPMTIDLDPLGDG